MGLLFAATFLIASCLLTAKLAIPFTIRYLESITFMVELSKSAVKSFKVAENLISKEKYSSIYFGCGSNSRAKSIAQIVVCYI